MDVCDKLNRYGVTQCAGAIVGDQNIFLTGVRETYHYQRARASIFHGKLRNYLTVDFQL